VRYVWLLLALTLLAAGCAGSSEDGGGSPSDGAPAGTSRAENDLVVLVDQGDGSEPVTWTLTCAGTAEGTHPAATEACAHLAGMAEPFAPLPDDVVCTEQYGGPQSAHVGGVWGGEPVDLEVTRVDGCRIDQWDGLVPLLPAVSGVAPPS
jgi:Subtilisin inhibitor-like